MDFDEERDLLAIRDAVLDVGGEILTLAPEGRLPVRQSPGKSDPLHPVNNHHQDWLNCIKTRERPVCDAAVGCRSTIVSHLGCIAHWTGRSLRWDPAKEEFIGDEEVNRLRSRTMREPWRI